MSKNYPPTVKIETPAAGFFESWAIKPAQWPTSECIFKDPSDKVWTGRDDVLRVYTGNKVIESLAIAITVIHKNGEPVWKWNSYGDREVKIKIEFIHDGEPSTFVRGIMYCK